MPAKEPTPVDITLDARPSDPIPVADRDPDPEPPATEPVARELVAAMADRLLEVTEGGPAVVYVGQVRNQSHAGGQEFRQLTRRLAVALESAGIEQGVTFTIDPDARADAVMHGAAYLVDGGRAPEWELFLSLQPVGERWTIWRSPSPVRMPRREGAGVPELRLVR